MEGGDFASGYKGQCLAGTGVATDPTAKAAIRIDANLLISWIELESTELARRNTLHASPAALRVHNRHVLRLVDREDTEIQTGPDTGALRVGAGAEIVDVWIRTEPNRSDVAFAVVLFESGNGFLPAEVILLFLRNEAGQAVDDLRHDSEVDAAGLLDAPAHIAAHAIFLYDRFGGAVLEDRDGILEGNDLADMALRSEGILGRPPAVEQGFGTLLDQPADDGNLELVAQTGWAETCNLSYRDLFEIFVLFEEKLPQVVLNRNLFGVMPRVEVPLASRSMFHTSITHDDCLCCMVLGYIGKLCIGYGIAQSLSTSRGFSGGIELWSEPVFRAILSTDLKGRDMDTIKAIMTRRSIRRFKDRPVDEKKIKTILRAAMQAPSARNSQPWHFIVITDRRLLSAIPEFHPNARMLLQAPTAVMICGDIQIEESIEYINTDCSAATQNLLLAAHALGLGAVWLGIYPRERRVEEIRKLLGIPRTITPIALVALGYAAEDKEPEERFQAKRVHRNRWESPES